ncbi:hypothetical protein PAXRUDRAFT_276268 [Paxillus rubicundulus Ve08.2h10]|uniref:Unplaced genomic scaffold scaffold_143, whole genome shotgun sequence n=1 Tax=Paxillus rubicundulus Ve08.2h10 TaxID=930991 RepID=A0A0D0E5X8_9AGAM|nr:hypothetical protein PAXRUDRAFT_276268 [Paxillus rubicundulus Ve08.2h10]
MGGCEDREIETRMGPRQDLERGIANKQSTTLNLITTNYKESVMINYRYKGVSGYCGYI